MLAVVGLGNPGAGYATTRHNAGFVLADALADTWDIRLRLVDRRAQAGSGSIDGTELLIVKPLTFMNRSGTVVRELGEREGFDFESDLLVLVDDAALPVGSFRVRPGGSAGGHNGLKSIDDALGSSEYSRLRIGVGPVPEGVDDLADFVLAEFEEDEIRAVADLIPTMVDAVASWVRDGVEKTMNRFNRRIRESE